MNWPIPDGMHGDPTVVRVSASMLDRMDRRCPSFVAAKAHPAVWPDVFDRRDSPIESFPLGLVMDALDRIELGDEAPRDAIEAVLRDSQKVIHPLLIRWMHHAVSQYVTASQDLADALAVDLRLDRFGRLIQFQDDHGWRSLVAWGRWYTSIDGTVREFRRLRMSRIRAEDLVTPAVAARARLLADGARATANVFRRSPPVPTADEPEPSAARIRIVEISLDTADHQVIVDVDPATARDAYLVQVRETASTLPDVTDQRRAGADCVECKLRLTCPALPKAPGLLGLPGDGTHRRTWSITSIQRYLTCPARAFARDVWLPSEPGPYSDARSRGVQVHDWLVKAHRRSDALPCRLVDLPDPTTDDALGVADGLLTCDEYVQVRPYLLQHLDQCPLATAYDNAEPEPTITGFDPDADVVVIAEPDLILYRDGVPIWRETKTAGAVEDFDRATALQEVPQLALAICLLADGVLGGTSSVLREPYVDGLVELEILTPDASDILKFSSADPATVAAARKVLVDLSLDWHDDGTLAPHPGGWCGSCGVRRWCSSAEAGVHAVAVVDGERVDLSTGELLDDVRPAPLRATAVAATASTIDVSEDDEPPPF